MPDFHFASPALSSVVFGSITQAMSASQRSAQRRSPATEPNPLPTPAPALPASTSGSQLATNQRGQDLGARTSSGSGKASSGKKKDVSGILQSFHRPYRSAAEATDFSPSKLLNQHFTEQQLSQIEKSVTHLLIATKQLLETLTRWSRRSATESDVSDVYVRLGYEFNIACRAFQSIGVDVSDLGPVPDLLRTILEETLSQEANQASLDRFLPRIRDIIINLLHGLKKKQQKLRARQNKDGTGVLGGRQISGGSVNTAGTGDTTLSEMLEDVPSRFGSTASMRTPDRRVGSGETLTDQPPVPARTSSSQHAPTLSREDAVNRMNGSPRGSMRERKAPPPTLSDSSLSSNTMQNIPVMTPEEYKLPIQRMSVQTPDELPPPPPPPKQQDALLALQRGGELERRASRRYSAYQISKHLGASPGGVPMLPAQNSPIPNRGRDVRDSLNAVRKRSSLVPTRSRSTRLRESPSRAAAVAKRISEESEPLEQPRIDTQAPPAPPSEDSPLAKTPEDMLGPSYVDSSGKERPAVGATLSGPPPNEFAPRRRGPPPQNPPADVDTDPEKSSVIHITRDSPESEEFVAEQSPQPGKELTLFLEYKSKIKKFVLPDGSNELSIARLQLAFIEKFAWNTHNNGVDLPEIYIQDSVSGVRHELEDLSDIKDRSVLVLNVEALDEVKRHFDDGFGGLKKAVEGLRSAMDGQKMSIAQWSDRQDAAAKEIARLAALPPAGAGSSAPTQVNGIGPIMSSEAAKAEIASLRRDVTDVRQSLSSFDSNMKSSFATLRTKADSVKAKAIDVSIPVLEGDTGRSYVLGGKKTLGEDCESIVNRVDDLQDIVEDLRKDVVNRGVRTLPRQLDQVNKDIQLTSKELKKMQDYVKREKPIWTKIWEKELEAVCNEREFLTVQEELMMDLEDDMEKLIQTVALVEQATKQQNSQSNTGQLVNLRNTTRGLNLEHADVDPTKAKDGVLGEVRALQPNHENRLEAIERAEKARQRELENRREQEAFRRELAEFVKDEKLKKSGGFEELERNRDIKFDSDIKDLWQKEVDMKAVRAKARAEERARQAQAQAAAVSSGEVQGEHGLDGELERAVNGDTGLGDGEMGNSAFEDTSEMPPPPVPSKGTANEEAEEARDQPLPELPKIDGGSGKPIEYTEDLGSTN